MFDLTLHDHLHLTFNEIIQRHDAHAAKAQPRARWSRRLRGGEAVLDRRRRHDRGRCCARARPGARDYGGLDRRALR